MDYEDVDPFEPNPDMTGIGVVIANISTVLCLRILITWSLKRVDVGVRACLIQVYPILLSSLASINQPQLTTSDITYALKICMSPLMVYLMFTSFCDLFGVKTGLYKRITSHPRTVRAFTILAPFLWIALNTTLSLSGRAFKDGVDGNQASFGEWLAGFSLTIIFSPFLSTGLTPYYLDFGFFGSLFLLCLSRRWSQVMADVRGHLKGRSGLRRRLCAPWMFVKCAWYAVDHYHKWWIYSLFIYLDVSWTITTAFSANLVFSYGQVLVILTSIPTLIETVKLIHARDRDLVRFLQRFPSVFLAEVLYLFAGIKPRPPDQDHRPPSTQSASHLPEFRPMTPGKGTGGGDDARSHTSDVELRGVSIAPPQVSPSKFESPTRSPHESLPEESEPPEDATPGHSNSPGLVEPHHNRTPQDRAGPPMLTIADVPSAVVRDLILALPSNKTAIESLELICAAHELNPLITESVIQTARENLPPVCENTDENGSNVTLAAVDTMHAPPLTGTHGSREQGP